MAKISTLSIEVDLRDKGAQQVIEKIGGSIKRLKVISGPTTQTIQKLRQQVIGLGKQVTTASVLSRVKLVLCVD